MVYKVLKQRVITAIILLSLLGAIVFNVSYQGFLLLVAIIFLLGAWEWSMLCDFQSLAARTAYLLLSAGLMLATVVSASAWNAEQMHITVVQYILGLGCLWWALALLWVKTYPANSALWGSRFVCALMGVLVLIPSWLALVYLRSLDQGLMWILYVLAIVVAADTGAYFMGRQFGRRKLLPAVSPGKSWAGFWGGFASAALLAIVTGIYAEVAGLSAAALLIVTMIAGLASVLGDLLESMVKRHRGVKDSGRLLPGHGGVMDRIDSITAAAPVFTLLAILLGRGA